MAVINLSIIRFRKLMLEEDETPVEPGDYSSDPGAIKLNNIRFRIFTPEEE